MKVTAEDWGGEGKKRVHSKTDSEGRESTVGKDDVCKLNLMSRLKFCVHVKFAVVI